MQSKKHSFYEVITNIGIGYGINQAIQIIIFPWFGIHIPLWQNFTLGIFFTIVAISRGYFIRRVFTKFYHEMQSRKGSLLEAVVNTSIGYLTAIISQMVIFPVFDIHISMSYNMGIAAIFTLVSVIRNYVIRRWWTKRTECCNELATEKV